MNRLVRAIAHALQRLASLLLGLAGDDDGASPQRPLRAGGSPPPDWLRRIRRDPPRDWLERVRRGRPRWMAGSTPVPPPWAAPLVDLDDVEAATPHPNAIQEAGREGAPTPTLPRKGGRFLSTPHPDPLPQGGRKKGSVGGEIVEAPTPHRNPPPQGGREGAGRVGGQITEGPAPHPDPRPQWGTVRSARVGGQITEAATRRPEPPPPGGMKRSGSWRGEMTPYPDAPPQGGSDRSGWRGVETAEAATTDLDPPPPWGVVRLLHADPPSDVRGNTNVVFEIGELPLAAAPDNPWPDLPADTPADAEDPITIWRGWERRERLAREQRGD